MSFDRAYYRDSGSPPASQDVTLLRGLEGRATGLSAFCRTYAGYSFERGLYRIHCVADMPKWTSIVTDAFPEFAQRVFCFACDWLGRHFALDKSRVDEDQYLIVMLEPGTGHALEIPANFHDFHHQELVKYGNEALAIDFFESWLSSGGESPATSECIGYIKPLFVGGEDAIENLELTDMEVYWSILGQLLAKVRVLAEGSRIGELRIDK